MLNELYGNRCIFIKGKVNTLRRHTIGTSPFAALVSDNILRYFFAIDMIPILAAFAFNDCSETIRETDVIFAERHSAIAEQWTPVKRTRPPITGLTGLNGGEWLNFSVATTQQEMSSQIRLVVHKFRWI
jgi:hypothetical protein